MINLATAAQEAQDEIGWATMPGTAEGDWAGDFTSGVINLARVVVSLSREVKRLEQRVNELEAK